MEMALKGLYFLEREWGGLEKRIIRCSGEMEGKR